MMYVEAYETSSKRTLFPNMRFIAMLITAVCVLSLINHNIDHLNVNVLLYSDLSMAVCGEISCKPENMIIIILL